MSDIIYKWSLKSTYSIVLSNVCHQDGGIQTSSHQVSSIVKSCCQLGGVHALGHHVTLAVTVDVITVQGSRERKVVGA